MKIFKSVFCMFTGLLLTLGLVACSSTAPISSESDEEILLHFSFPDHESVLEFAQKSDCIVIASFDENPNEIDSLIKTDIDPEGSLISLTKYTMNIERVYKGDIADHFTFVQLGKSTSNTQEQKISKNTRYLLFLCQKPSDEGEIQYDANCMERGIIKLNKNDIMEPLSDSGITYNLKDKPLSELPSMIN